MTEVDDPEEQKWMRIKLLYDQLDRTRRSGSSRKTVDENGNKLTTEEMKEREGNKQGTEESKTKQFQLNIVETLDWSFEGVTRLNYCTSNQNIAHVVLRNHEREFFWKRLPYKPRTYIYNDVWERMCEKAAEWKNKIADEREMFDRYDGGGSLSMYTTCDLIDLAKAMLNVLREQDKVEELTKDNLDELFDLVSELWPE